jgi:hypothetical protein
MGKKLEDHPPNEEPVDVNVEKGEGAHAADRTVTKTYRDGCKTTIEYDNTHKPNQY